MKKAFLSLLLVLGIIIGFVGINSKKVNALDESKEALTVNDVNWDGANWNMLLVNMGTPSGYPNPWGPAIDASYIVLTDKNGTAKTFDTVQLGDYLHIYQYTAEVGDILTLKAGLEFGGKELKADVKYQYTTANAPWTVYVEQEAPKPAINVVDVNYDGASWNMLLVNMGTPSGYPNPWGPEIADGMIELVDKDGNAKTFATVQLGNYIHVHQYTPAVGDKITLKAGLAFGEGEIKEDVTYVYTTEGQPWTVYVPEMPAFSIVSVNYSADWHGTLLQVSEFTGAYAPNWGNGPDMEHLIYKDSQGNVKETTPALHDHHIFILSFEPVIGDTVEIKAGTVINGYELKEDVKYIFVSATAPWEVYSSAYDVTELNVAEAITARVDATTQIEATINEGAAATPVYESANSEIATVDANGVVKGIKVGTTTITVKAGSITKTINVTVKEPATLEAVVAETIYKVYVVKGAEFALPENFSAKAKFSDNGETVYGEAFALTQDNCAYDAVDTTTVGTQNVTLKITYNEEVYNIEIAVEVYEIDEMEVKEIAIVEWFAFNIFVQFPNSTTNNANLTSASMYPDATKYTYTRADGTVITCGTYNLGGGNVVILPGFIDGDVSLENFSSEKYYQIGDTITLQAGFGGYLWTGEMAPTATDNGAIAPNTGMAIKECELKKELVYKFDGSTWGIYIEYTDFEVANEEIELTIGKTVSCGATRIPVEATVGEFTYSSSDETVAKVNARGVISGVAAGTATITVTLNGGTAGEITKTITVTVVDAVSKVEVADVIKVAAGAELDLTNVEATVTYASGKTETVKIGNATVTGFDASETDEQTVVVKVTVGETEYTVQVKVQVEGGNTPSGTTTVGGNTTTAGGNDPVDPIKKGCGNSIIASFGLIACLGACVVALKKKKENE